MFLKKIQIQVAKEFITFLYHEIQDPAMEVQTKLSE